MIVRSQFFKGSDCWVEEYLELFWQDNRSLEVATACHPLHVDAANSNLGQVQYSPIPTDTKPYQAIASHTLTGPQQPFRSKLFPSEVQTVRLTSSVVLQMSTQRHSRRGPIPVEFRGVGRAEPDAARLSGRPPGTMFHDFALGKHRFFFKIGMGN